MDKSNFKKLALMGMAGGMLIASQTPMHAEMVDQTQVMLAGCGSKGCNSHSSANNKNRFTADAQTDIQKQQQQAAQQSNRKMTESELMSQLNSEGKELFRGLDPEGKALALDLASKSSDKNQAVKAAAQKMAFKRAQMNQGSSMNQSPSMNQGYGSGQNRW